jgi:hypothetical protein
MEGNFTVLGQVNLGQLGYAQFIGGSGALGRSPYFFLLEISVLEINAFR